MLFAQDGTARLAGFGLGHIFGECPGGEPQAGSPVIDPASLIYAAPERLTSRGAGDARSDLYAVAALMYEALRGETHLTFAGCLTFDDFRRTVTKQDARPLVIRATPFNRRMTEVIMQALEKQPARRFRSAADMALALRDRLKLLGPAGDLE